MNIGRTIRVFRAEPVAGPLADAPPPEPVRPPVATAEKAVEVETTPDPAPARLGG